MEFPVSALSLHDNEKEEEEGEEISQRFFFSILYFSPTLLLLFSLAKAKVRKLSKI